MENVVRSLYTIVYIVPFRRQAAGHATGWSWRLRKSRKGVSMLLADLDLTSCLRRPLCQRYVLCVADAVVVRWRHAAGVRERELHWLFGWLADGECEPLGAWMGPQSLRQMRADLKDRGVLRISHVARLHDALPQSEGAACSIEMAFPGAMTSPRPALWPAAQAVADDVRQRLARAVRRHGSFENDAVALDFVAGALQRAERRLDRERRIAKERPRLDSGARMAPPASADATTRASWGQE
jgi:transposase-like protein